MSAHFNQLTPAEAERLALLAEECGEVIQAVGKILRHGYESRNPLIAEGPTNRESLERELGDVHAAIILLRNSGDVSGEEIIARCEKKQASVGFYMHHQDAAWCRHG